MNKAVKLILLMLMIAVLLTGCCFHDWEDATCTDPRTCADCGETKGEALGHAWEEADCEQPKTCTVCGKTRGEAKGHEWNGLECEACGETRPDPKEVGAVSWDINYFMKWYTSNLDAHHQPMSLGEMEQTGDNEFSFAVYYEDIHAVQVTLTVDDATGYITHILAQQQPGELPNANEHGMGHNSCVAAIYAAYMELDFDRIRESLYNPVLYETREGVRTSVFRLDDLRIVMTHTLTEYGEKTAVEIMPWEDSKADSDAMTELTPGVCLFEKGSFVFTPNQFAKYYLSVLQEQDSAVNANPIAWESDDTAVIYYGREGISLVCLRMTVDKETGKVTDMLFSISPGAFSDLDNRKLADQFCIQGVIVSHGQIARDTWWSIFYNLISTEEKDGMIREVYDMEGLRLTVITALSGTEYQVSP